MSESITPTVEFPASLSRDMLTAILREGAQQMLATAIDAEVSEWIAGHAHFTDETGRRQVVRNGRLPKRKLITG